MIVSRLPLPMLLPMLKSLLGVRGSPLAIPRPNEITAIGKSLRKRLPTRSEKPADLEFGSTARLRN
jgi:hypothetical protein